MDNLERAQWRKSSYSGGNGGACVEVASNLPGVIAVRDSKNPTGPKLVLTRDAWRDFTRGVHNGEFKSA
jgi:hypothetical protein